MWKNYLYKTFLKQTKSINSQSIEEQIISICDRDNVRCRLLASKPANPNETSFQNIQTPKITWKLTELLTKMKPTRDWCNISTLFSSGNCTCNLRRLTCTCFCCKHFTHIHTHPRTQLFDCFILINIVV